jgi:hypothetical protein
MVSMPAQGRAVEGKQRVAILDQALDSLVMTPQISMKASNAASRGLGPLL